MEKTTKETDSCFWLVNATEPDKTKPPSVACRSLACLRLELERNKTASSVKLRTAYDNRSNDNSIAADVLRKSRLWQRLGGPSPDALFSPSRSSLDRCAACLSALEELEAKEGVDEAFANEVRKAVGLLKSLAWDDIRIERFPLTPPGLYTELVRNAERPACPDMFCLRVCARGCLVDVLATQVLIEQEGRRGDPQARVAQGRGGRSWPLACAIAPTKCGHVWPCSALSSQAGSKRERKPIKHSRARLMPRTLTSSR